MPVSYAESIDLTKKFVTNPSDHIVIIIENLTSFTGENKYS